MAKERLSKLQKWILVRCLTNTRIQRCEIRGFFEKVFYPIAGKKVYMRADDTEKRYGKQGVRPEDFAVIRNGPDWWMYPKPELRSTQSIEATISRSLGGLRSKGLIQGERWLSLTEKGFLIVNKQTKNTNLLTFSEYTGKIEEMEQKKLIQGMGIEKLLKMAKVFGIDFPKD